MSESDSKTLQAILTEVQGIHDDIRATETAQILLAELEMEQGTVNRASQRLEDARSKLVQVQKDQKVVAADLEAAEDRLNQASDSAEQKALTQDVERLKSNLAALKSDEQARSSTRQEAQDQLRIAQDALDSTQNELNTIVKRFSPGRN